MDHSLSIRLGCFQFGGNMNKAAKTFIYRYFCGHKISSDLGDNLGAQLLDWWEDCLPL